MKNSTVPRIMSKNKVWISIYLLFGTMYSVVMGVFTSLAMAEVTNRFEALRVSDVRSAVYTSPGKLNVCIKYSQRVQLKKSDGYSNFDIDLDHEELRKVSAQLSSDYVKLSVLPSGVLAGCNHSELKKGIRIIKIEHYGPDFDIEYVKRLGAGLKAPFLIVEEESPEEIEQLAFGSKIILVLKSASTSENLYILIDVNGREVRGNIWWAASLPIAFLVDVITFPLQFLAYVLFAFND